MKGLVKRYKQDTQGVDGKLRDQLIMDYAPLIRFVAQRIAARLPSNIDIDDLISAGVIGLMDAIDKYDPSRDNKFKTYAGMEHLGGTSNIGSGALTGERDELVLMFKRKSGQKTTKIRL